MSDATEPVFDASGKYLYFLASTDAGPVNQWFNLSSRDMRATRSLYLAVLRKDMPSPFRRESDEEKPTSREAERRAGQARAGEDRLRRPRPADAAVPAAGRRLPDPPGRGAGQVLYLSQLAAPARAAGPPRAALMRYDLANARGRRCSPA